MWKGNIETSWKISADVLLVSLVPAVNIQVIVRWKWVKRPHSGFPTFPVVMPRIWWYLMVFAVKGLCSLKRESLKVGTSTGWVFSLSKELQEDTSLLHGGVPSNGLLLHFLFGARRSCQRPSCQSLRLLHQLQVVQSYQDVEVQSKTIRDHCKILCPGFQAVLLVVWRFLLLPFPEQWLNLS